MVRLEVAVRLSFADFELAVDHAFGLEGITALFGASGCGKTTLLRIIAGLERGADGRVRFDGETWQDGERFVPAHRRSVGYVFQDVRLFPHLTVEGNLRYADRRSQRGNGHIHFAGVVDGLDLAALLKRRPASLSGGERQRVAIGRSLLTRPSLLLMDEPLAALDTRRKAAILPHIARLPAVFGIPVIYVTHSLDEVTQLAGRMVAMSDGHVIAAGGVVDLLQRLDLEPASGHFEAGVLVTGTIVGHDTQFHTTRVDLGGQRLEMPGVDVAPGTEVRLRIRARDVSLAVERPAGISIRNILEGTLTEIAEDPTHAFAETWIDIGGQRLRARVTRAAVHELGLIPRMPVFALVKSIAFDRRMLAAGAAIRTLAADAPGET